MTADLPTYLSEAGRQPWQWGVSDCILFCADWVALRCGVDPAAAWRGTYHNEADCLDRLMDHGGLIRAVTAGMEDAGFVRTDEPTTGDVGIVRAYDKTICGGICVGENMWVVRSIGGQTFAPLKMLRAWKVPNHG